MTRDQYNAILQYLPEIHEGMSNGIPPSVQDSIFKQLNILDMPEDDDECYVIGQAIIFTLYGFRPGGQSMAEAYALREKDRAEGVRRDYLEAVGSILFSIFRVLEPSGEQEEGQVRLQDELDQSHAVFPAWFEELSEMGRQTKSVGLPIAGYLVPLHGGWLHIGGLLTVSEELLGEAMALKAKLGNRRPGELAKFVTRRALREEIELRARMGED